MTPRSFSNKSKGFEKEKLNDLLIRRHFTAVIASGMGAKADPTKFFPIEEFDQKDVEIASQEEIKKQLDKWEELDKKEWRKYKA